MNRKPYPEAPLTRHLRVKPQSNASANEKSFAERNFSALTRVVEHLPPLLQYVFAGIQIIVIGMLDIASGLDLATSIFYLLPVGMLAWHRGWPAARVAVVAATLMWFAAEKLNHRTYDIAAIAYWNASVRAGFFIIVGYMLSRLRLAGDNQQRLARTDSLTGVANSRSFLELAEQEIARQRRFRQPLSVAYFDCDNFKDVNDIHGHAAGDELLRRIAVGVESCLREVDVVARLGGDEFAILLPVTDAHAAEIVCGKVRESLRGAVEPYDVTFSIGLVTFVTPPHDVEAMLHAADDTMYEAKNSGKNRSRHRVVGTLLADGNAHA